MNIEKILRKQSYDLIEGPIRDFSLLQLHVKDPAQAIQNTGHFLTDDPAEVKSLSTDPAKMTDIDYTKTHDVDINHTAKVLEKLLEKLNMGNLGAEFTQTFDRTVTMSYKNSTQRELNTIKLDQFLSDFDFDNSYRMLKREGEENDLIIITGVVESPEINWKLTSKSGTDLKVDATIKKLVDIGINPKINTEKTVEFTTNGVDPLVFGVKAHRIIFKNDKYDKLRPITDNRRLFK